MGTTGTPKFTSTTHVPVVSSSCTIQTSSLVTNEKMSNMSSVETHVSKSTTSLIPSIPATKPSVLSSLYSPVTTAFSNSSTVTSTKPEKVLIKTERTTPEVEVIEIDDFEIETNMSDETSLKTEIEKPNLDVIEIDEPDINAFKTAEKVVVSTLQSPVMGTSSNSSTVTSTMPDTPAVETHKITPNIEIIETDDVEIKSVAKKRKMEDKQKSVCGEYFYFCVDCEAGSSGSRYPLTLDIASHILQEEHFNFKLIKDVFPDIEVTGRPRLENISYNSRWNKKVTKDWQKMVIGAKADEMIQFKYQVPRKCLKCDLRFHDSADMFLHIREKHVKKR